MGITATAQTTGTAQLKWNSESLLKLIANAPQGSTDTLHETDSLIIDRINAHFGPYFIVCRSVVTVDSTDPDALKSLSLELGCPWELRVIEIENHHHESNSFFSKAGYSVYTVHPHCPRGTKPIRRICDCP